MVNKRGIKIRFDLVLKVLEGFRKEIIFSLNRLLSLLREKE